MIVFNYDNSFEGLLCAVFDAYTLRLFPNILSGKEESRMLLAGRGHSVVTVQAHYERVERGLLKRLSPRGFRRLQYAWLSEEPGADMALFVYIRKVFDSHRSVEADYADPDVFAVDRLAQKTGKEAQHLLGFVRFQKTVDGKYAATISPRHNVLPLLPRHFASRFADQEWLIYDMKRGYGVLCDSQGFHEVFLDRERAAQLVKNNGRLPASELDDEELLVQEMWKTYFAAVAIKERRNPRLQARCMPRRFWEYLTEKQC